MQFICTFFPKRKVFHNPLAQCLTAEHNVFDDKEIMIIITIFNKITSKYCFILILFSHVCFYAADV